VLPTKDSAALLHCGISIWPTSAVGQSRRTKQAATSPDVRFTSDSDQTGASQRSDALCHKATYAVQQGFGAILLSVSYHRSPAGAR
jgi:hypothetical protein